MRSSTMGGMIPRLIYRLSIRFWHVGRVTNWLVKLPWIGTRLTPKLFDPEESQAIIIPVQEAIRGGESVVLPYMLLPALIEHARHRAILNHCMCREAEGCTEKPHDLGCLFLGEGAARIDPALGRAVDQEEALVHMAAAMETGLLPTILHSSMDAFMLQIPYRKMLAICFCCECCCTIRKGMRAGPRAAWETVSRLPGLNITIGGACVGCGTCVDECPVQAITLMEGRATIGESCKGCGRCVVACPEGAIALRIDDEGDVTANLLRLVERRTTITG